MKLFLLIGIGVFVALNGLCFLLRLPLAAVNTPLMAALYGNAWLLIVTTLAYYFERRGVREANSHAFFRWIYTGMLLKMFLCIAAVVVYAFTDRAAITKGAVLVWLLFYIIYTGVEISLLLRESKERR